MITSKKELIKLTNKEKDLLLKLLNKNQILEYLSSEASEGLNKEFKDNYGTTIDFANESLTKLCRYLAL